MWKPNNCLLATSNTLRYEKICEDIVEALEKQRDVFLRPTGSRSISLCQAAARKHHFSIGSGIVPAREINSFDMLQVWNSISFLLSFRVREAKWFFVERMASLGLWGLMLAQARVHERTGLLNESCNAR